MYYKYWNLTKPPFDNVPDPSMYADCHESMENALGETLFAIEEGEECFAVIVGDVGLGKTLSIRMIIDSLDQEKYKIALITNPSLTFVQLLREIIGQLTGKMCEEKKKVDMLEIFNKLLFETYDNGKKIVIFIDEANVISRKNLENLRLLTNMQDDDKNLFTLILAGQIELAKRLEHPSLANLFQRIGTYCKIDKIESPELTMSYVNSRLKLSGCKKAIFTNDAYQLIWQLSENGVPRLINKICKLSLKAGETNSLKFINGDVINQVAARFQRTTFSSVSNAGRADKAKNSTKQRPNNNKGHAAPKIVDAQIESDNDDDLCREMARHTANKNESLIENINSTNSRISFSDKLEIVEENSAEINIDGVRVKVNFPEQFIQNVRSSSIEDRLKLSGAMAARIIKENPKLTSSCYDDPVSIWSDLRDMIMSKIQTENVAV